MLNHDYAKLHKHREQQLQHFEERRQALREGLEREFAGLGVEVKDFSEFDRMAYCFVLVKDGRGLNIAWLERDFSCCGENLFVQSVRDIKRKMGLPL